MQMINPMDIDPETNRPYSNYSSDSLDTSFHDGEMDVDDAPIDPWVLRGCASCFEESCGGGCLG